MQYTLNDYLDQLTEDKSTLVTNLTAKGVEASDEETFTSLVPKVLDITSVNNQIKSDSITANGTYTYTPDTGYTGLSSVSITANVSADLSDYFTSTISSGAYNKGGFVNMIKTIPSTTTVSGTSLQYGFLGYNGTTIPQIDTSNITNMSSMFKDCKSLTSVPLLNTSKVTSMTDMFNGCTNLTSIPQFDTSKVENASGMFSGCTNLIDIPLFDMSSALNLNNMYNFSTIYTDTSIDNILQMCTTVPNNYSNTKTLQAIGFNSYYTQASKIQALPHYQDFINAGWTIGY